MNVSSSLAHQLRVAGQVGDVLVQGHALLGRTGLRDRQADSQDRVGACVGPEHGSGSGLGLELGLGAQAAEARAARAARAGIEMPLSDLARAASTRAAGDLPAAQHFSASVP